MADSPDTWTVVSDHKTKKSQTTRKNTARTASRRTAGMQRRAPKTSVSASANVMDPPKTVLRKVSAPQTTQSKTTQVPASGAADTKQLAPEPSAKNPLEPSNSSPLSSAVAVPMATTLQNIQKNTASVADPLETTMSYATVLGKAVASLVPEHSTKHMPREVAKGMKRNARRVMMTAAPVVVEKLEALPEELMDKMLPDAVPDRIDLANPETVLVPGRLPSFMPSVVRLSNSMRQLKYIQAVLRNTVLEVSSLRDLDMLNTWLKSIDFTHLPHNLRNGFDAVRALSFSDINRSSALTFDQTWPAPSTWAKDLELAQKCKDLRYVEVDVSLPESFLVVIENAYSMKEAMEVMEASKPEGEDGLQTYQLTRLLELKGLKVLRLRFFTEGWHMTTLDGEKMHMVASWLGEEFAARKQSTEVLFFSWFE